MRVRRSLRPFSAGVPDWLGTDPPAIAIPLPAEPPFPAFPAESVRVRLYRNTKVVARLPEKRLISAGTPPLTEPPFAVPAAPLYALPCLSLSLPVAVVFTPPAIAEPELALPPAPALSWNRKVEMSEGAELAQMGTYGRRHRSNQGRQERLHLCCLMI